MDIKTQLEKKKVLRSRLPGSWIQTVQHMTGSRPHKPSFMVLDIGQSGGMHLANWFYAHKEITFQENILAQPVRFPRLSVYQRVRQSNSKVYGFSATVEQLCQVQHISNPNQFLQDLVRGGCRIIYLNRKDALRHAIATLRAHSINYRFGTPETRSKFKPFIVDVSELIACLHYFDNQRVEAKAVLHDVAHMSLTYEEDLIDPNCYQATAQRLSSFLDVSKIEPVGNSVKLVHRQMEDIVANYDELKAGLENSDYGYLLSDNKYLLTV